MGNILKKYPLPQKIKSILFAIKLKTHFICEDNDVFNYPINLILIIQYSFFSNNCNQNFIKQFNTNLKVVHRKKSCKKIKILTLRQWQFIEYLKYLENR